MSWARISATFQQSGLVSLSQRAQLHPGRLQSLTNILHSLTAVVGSAVGQQLSLGGGAGTDRRQLAVHPAEQGLQSCSHGAGGADAENVRLDLGRRPRDAQCGSACTYARQLGSVAARWQSDDHSVFQPVAAYPCGGVPLP